LRVNSCSKWEVMASWVEVRRILRIVG
jgi:hypothetical protein